MMNSKMPNVLNIASRHSVAVVISIKLNINHSRKTYDTKIKEKTSLHTTNNIMFSTNMNKTIWNTIKTKEKTITTLRRINISIKLRQSDH